MLVQRLAAGWHGCRARLANPRPGTLNRKVRGVFLFSLLLGAGNIVVVLVMLDSINGMAETINVAGRLRMLSQKVAFETQKAQASQTGAPQQARATLHEFERGLDALAFGGTAFGYRLHKVSRQHALELATIGAAWQDYRSQVEALLNADGNSGAAPAAGALTRNANRVLVSADALVASLTSEAHQAQQQGLLELYFLLLFDIVAMVFIYLGLQRQLVAPLRQLASHGRTLAAGNYETRVAYRAPDEIGQLADAFNAATARIRHLLAGLEQERHNIRQAESMFRGLAENSVVGVYIAQGEHFRFVNPKMAAMFGYARDDLSGGVPIADIVSRGDRPRMQAAMRTHLLREGQEANYQVCARRKDGATFDVEVFSAGMELDGKPSVIGVMLDITERKQIERALRVLTACNQAMVRARDESALLHDICRIIRRLSGYPFVWVGYTDDGAEKKVMPAAQAAVDGDALHAVSADIAWNESRRGCGVTGMAVRTGKTAIVQDVRGTALYAIWPEFIDRHAIGAAISLPLKAGERVLGALTVYSEKPHAFIADEVGIMEELADNLAYGIVALRSEAERRHYQRQLEYHANHDSLTGLANRACLGDRMRQAILAAERTGHLVGVLLLDLDHFKVINDSLGHAAGDALLQAVAARLAASVRKVDTVARLGGDEFVIVMPEIASAENAAVIAGKVLDALAQSFAVGGKEIHVSTSIGISLYPHDGACEKVLLKNVDMAMYRAKQNGRANFHFYTEEMNAHNRERHALQTELHFALARGELLLHYQPKMDLKSGKIVGVEALIRWLHPERGLILPEKFIPLAEETGLIIPIGTWIMQTACRQNLAWQAAGLPPIGIAVNLSAWQFHRRDLVGLVKQVLADTGMRPQFLELELTESVIIHEPDEAVPALMGLKELGVQLSLDDFGTGYSSLNYLRRFPFNNLKIDRLFVEGITVNQHDSTIINAVISLAHKLNLKVIAEGVETPEELAFLSAHDCDEIQGYYFSKPLPGDQVLALLLASRA